MNTLPDLEKILKDHKLHSTDIYSNTNYNVERLTKYFVEGIMVSIIRQRQWNQGDGEFVSWIPSDIALYDYMHFVDRSINRELFTSTVFSTIQSQGLSRSMDTMGFSIKEGVRCRSTGRPLFKIGREYCSAERVDTLVSHNRKVLSDQHNIDDSVFLEAYNRLYNMTVLCETFPSEFKKDAFRLIAFYENFTGLPNDINAPRGEKLQAILLPYTLYKDIYTMVLHYYERRLSQMKDNISRIGAVTGIDDSKEAIINRVQHLNYQSNNIMRNFFYNLATDETSNSSILRHITTINPNRGHKPLKKYHFKLINEYNVISGEERNNALALNINDLKDYGGYYDESSFNKSWFSTVFSAVTTAFTKIYTDINIEYNKKLNSIVLYNITAEEMTLLLQTIVKTVADYTIRDFISNKKSNLTGIKRTSYMPHANQFDKLANYLKTCVHVQTLGEEDYSECIDIYKQFKQNNIKESSDERFLNYCYTGDGNIGYTKVIIRGADNYDLQYKKSDSTTDKCQRDMTTIHDRLEKVGVAGLEYKKSLGNTNCGLEIFTNDLSQINIVKLFGIKKYTVMVPMGLNFISVEEKDAFKNIIK